MIPINVKCQTKRERTDRFTELFAGFTNSTRAEPGVQGGSAKGRRCGPRLRTAHTSAAPRWGLWSLRHRLFEQNDWVKPAEERGRVTIAKLYRGFGQYEARGVSETYETWALDVSEDHEVLTFLESIPLRIGDRT